MKRRTIFILVFSVILIISGALILKTQENKLTLTTQDGIKLSARYYSSNSEKGVILLHMLDNKKESYDLFAQSLNKEGYAVIAVDLRGHGESELNWKDFRLEEFKGMVFDAKAAHNYLLEKGITNVAIIGASIGSNTAINYAAEAEISTVILLSPGLDYRGVGSAQAIQNYQNPVFIAVSKEDEYSYESSKALFDLIQSNERELKVYDGNLHGTNMFGRTDVESLIFNWLKNHL